VLDGVLEDLFTDGPGVLELKSPLFHSLDISRDGLAVLKISREILGDSNDLLESLYVVGNTTLLEVLNGGLN